MDADAWKDAEERLEGAQVVADLLEVRLLRGGMSEGAHRVVMRSWERAVRTLEHQQGVVNEMRRSSEWGV